MRNNTSSRYRKFTKGVRQKALKELAKARDDRVLADMAIKEKARAARHVGASWDEVAEALGCSRAWAHRQFRLSQEEQILENIGLTISGVPENQERFQ